MAIAQTSSSLTLFITTTCSPLTLIHSPSSTLTTIAFFAAFRSISKSQTSNNASFKQLLLISIHFDHWILVTRAHTQQSLTLDSFVSPKLHFLHSLDSYTFMICTQLNICMLHTYYCHISITKSCFTQSDSVTWLHPPIANGDDTILSLEN
jgi:hypothetical protein